ncbi:hypothetical protein ACHAWX_000721, partial [Stephanocyclus meneghinianus]
MLCFSTFFSRGLHMTPRRQHQKVLMCIGVSGLGLVLFLFSGVENKGLVTQLHLNSANDKIKATESISFLPGNHCGYDTIDYISNSTREFLEYLSMQGNIQPTYNPQILLNLSHSFESTIVGEEFLHLGVGACNYYLPDNSNDTNSRIHKSLSQLELLGKKLAEHNSIKIVWFGGSNTYGRTKHSFVTEIKNMVNEKYLLRSSKPRLQRHKFLNRGIRGGTCCHFAKGFKSEYFNVDIKGADLVFLEFSVNDGVLSKDEIHSCYESLIIRIHRVSPTATIVALCITNREEHHGIIRHYDLPQIYLGSVSEQFPSIFLDKSHLNDVGSFLVRQAVGVLLHECIILYNISVTFKGNPWYGESAASPNDGHENININRSSTIKENTYRLPSRLFEPAEIFDWIAKLDDQGEGRVIHNIQELQVLCFPANGKNASTLMVNLMNASMLVLTNDTVKCSKFIVEGIPSQNMIWGEKDDVLIPCKDCPKPYSSFVKKLGGGWIWCGNQWTCRPTGIYHSHCSNYDNAGIFLQTFQIDNRATDNWPGNFSRKITLVIRLLKGYDEDFGKCWVVLWINKPTPATSTFVDTKWDKQATVLSDVQIADSYPIPSPDTCAKINLTIAIIPIDFYHHKVISGATLNKTSIATPRKCRLYFHSIL